MLGLPKFFAVLSVLAFFTKAVRAAPPPGFTYANISAPSSPDLNPSIYGYVDADGDPVWVITVPADLGPWTEITVDGVAGSNYIFDTNALNISQDLDLVNDGTDEATDIEVYGYDSDSSLVITVSGLSTVAGATSFLGSFLLTIYYGETSTKLLKREIVTYELTAVVSAGEISSGAATAAPSTSETISPSLTTVITEIPSTTVITVTSCSDNKCHESTATTGVLTITSTSEDVVTVYTTYCPLTAQGPTKTKTYTPWTPPAPTATKTVVVTAMPEGTTTLTVTSCHDNKCKASAKPTGFNVVTTTLEDIVTVYTTYCPLTQHEYTKTVYVTPTPTNIVVVTYTETVTVTAGTTTVYEPAEDVTKTTGFTTVTSTSEDVVVVYTTFCPLTHLKEHKFEVTYAEVTSTASVMATTTEAVSFLNSRGTTVTKTAAPASATTVAVTSSVEATTTVATGAAAAKTTTTSGSSSASTLSSSTSSASSSSSASVAAVSTLSSALAPSFGPVTGSVFGGLVFVAALFV